MSKKEINWHEVTQRKQERINELERKVERQEIFARSLGQGMTAIDAEIERLQKERDYWRDMAQKGGLGMNLIWLMFQIALDEVKIGTVIIHEGGMAALQKELTPVLADLEYLRPELDRAIDELIGLSRKGEDDTLQSARSNLARESDSYYEIARSLVEVRNKAEFPKRRKKAVEEIAELHSEEYRQHAQDIWKLASGGAQQNAAIDHLCDLADPLKEQGLKWDEVVEWIDKNLAMDDVSYALWWGDWDGHQDENLKRAYNRRQMRITSG